MIKRIWLLCAVIILLPLSGFRHPAEWTIFTSTMGHYAISFPGFPTEKADIEHDIHILSYAPSDTEVYILAWTDMRKYYPANKTITELLEEGRDGAIESMKATNLQTLNVVTGESPYIEFTFRTPHIAGKERIYIVNKFQYSVMALADPNTGLTPGLEKFLTTFIYLP